MTEAMNRVIDEVGGGEIDEFSRRASRRILEQVEWSSVKDRPARRVQVFDFDNPITSGSIRHHFCSLVVRLSIAASTSAGDLPIAPSSEE